MTVRYDKLIDLSDIKERIKYIDNSLDYYISENGNIYRNINGKYYKKTNYTNPNGYLYVQISYIDGCVLTKRVHRLVAIAFVENPNNYNIVHHKDNNKSNNTYTNLEWTTVSLNTKLGYIDGCSKNDKGYEDNQSYPVIMLDSITHMEINKYGSIREASRETGYVQSTIARQCKNNSIPKLPHYFKYDENYVSATTIENRAMPISRVDDECNSRNRSARLLIRPIIYNMS